MLFREGEVVTLNNYGSNVDRPWNRVVKIYKVLYADKDIALLRLISTEGSSHPLDVKTSLVKNHALSTFGTVLGMDGWYIVDTVQELYDDDSECI